MKKSKKYLLVIGSALLILVLLTGCFGQGGTPAQAEAGKQGQSLTPQAPVVSAEEKLAVAESNAAAAEQRASDLQNQVNTLTSEKSALETELADAQKSLQMANDELTKAKEAVQKAADPATLKQAQDDLAAAQTKVNDLTTQLTKAQSDLQTANDKAAQLEKDLAAAKVAATATPAATPAASGSDTGAPQEAAPSNVVQLLAPGAIVPADMNLLAVSPQGLTMVSKNSTAAISCPDNGWKDHKACGSLISKKANSFGAWPMFFDVTTDKDGMTTNVIMNWSATELTDTVVADGGYTIKAHKQEGSWYWVSLAVESFTPNSIHYFQFTPNAKYPKEPNWAVKMVVNDAGDVIVTSQKNSYPNMIGNGVWRKSERPGITFENVSYDPGTQMVTADVIFEDQRAWQHANQPAVYPDLSDYIPVWCLNEDQFGDCAVGSYDLVSQTVRFSSVTWDGSAIRMNFKYVLGDGTKVTKDVWNYVGGPQKDVWVFMDTQGNPGYQFQLNTAALASDAERKSLLAAPAGAGLIVPADFTAEFTSDITFVGNDLGVDQEKMLETLKALP